MVNAVRREQQPNVWRQLIAAGRRREPLLLRQVQLRGPQLLARSAGARGLREGEQGGSQAARLGERLPGRGQGHAWLTLC